MTEKVSTYSVERGRREESLLAGVSLMDGLCFRDVVFFGRGPIELLIDAASLAGEKSNEFNEGGSVPGNSTGLG